MKDDPRPTIWALIRASNRAWTEGRPSEVAPLFRPQVVMIAPGLASRVDGREAMVKSFEDYVGAVRTLAFEEHEHAIDVFGDTAVATYRFSVRYVLDGQTHDETGQEVLVFTRDPTDASWRAVWRTQFPL